MFFFHKKAETELEERSLRKGEITTEAGGAAAVYLVGMVAQKRVFTRGTVFGQIYTKAKKPASSAFLSGPKCSSAELSADAV